MRFDVIIGNPPYQENDGGGMGSSAIPIYNKFIEQAIRLNPRHLSFIIPARWYTGGKGLNAFREKMLSSGKIKEIHDYVDSKECFSNVDIKGGVCYFLMDMDYTGDCKVVVHKDSIIVSSVLRNLIEFGSDIFIRNNEDALIINKVTSMSLEKFSKIVSTRNPFGLISSFNEYKEEYSEDYPIKLYTVNGQGWISRDTVKNNVDYIDKYKVLIPKAWGDGIPSKDRIKPILAKPGSCCTETYLLVGPFESKKQAENCMSFIRTGFLHFLVSVKKNTQNAARGVYDFVPLVDFDTAWDDDKLFKEFNLINEEIKHIRETVNCN